MSENIVYVLDDLKAFEAFLKPADLDTDLTLLLELLYSRLDVLVDRFLDLVQPRLLAVERFLSLLLVVVVHKRAGALLEEREELHGLHR